MKPKRIKVTAICLSIFMVMAISVNAFEPYYHHSDTSHHHIEATDITSATYHLYSLSHDCTQGHKNNHHEHQHPFGECCCGVTASFSNISDSVFLALFYSTYNIPKKCLYNSLDIFLIYEPPRS